MKSIILFMFTFLCLDPANAGIFVKTPEGYLLKEKELDGSIIDVCKRLGFDRNMFYTYFDTDKNSDIFQVCFKSFTSDIICVFTNDNVLELREQDVKSYLSGYNFTFEYSTYNRENDLNEGIKKKNLSITFLADALNIPYNPISTDTMLVCDKFKYNLYFKDGFLCKFESSDGYNSAAKEFMETSPDYFNDMKLYAEEYWGDDIKNIQNELNTQCEALYNLPDGFNNEYLNRFILDNGGYNFKVVSVLYYHDTFTLREFKDICHGEAKYITEKEIKGKTVYAYGYKKAVFLFTKDGKLLISKPF